MESKFLQRISNADSTTILALATPRWLACWLLAAGLLGCGAAGPYDGTDSVADSATAGGREPSRATTTKLVAAQTSPAAARMIVYQAQVTAETEDFEQFSTALATELAELGGFVASSNEQRVAGDQRAGVWTLRVPSERFADMMSWLDENANVFRKEVRSQDMTDEYVDLTARIANRKNSEQRLAEILKARAGGLEDVLTIEREIDRVREDIERMEGRLRLLSERIALSTIALDISTRVQDSPAKPTFATRIAEAWGGSLGLLNTVGQAAAVFAVAMAPWVLAASCIGGLAVGVVRYGKLTLKK